MTDTDTDTDKNRTVAYRSVGLLLTTYAADSKHRRQRSQWRYINFF